MAETPDALRHRLSPAEQADVDAAGGEPERLSAAWCPLGPADAGLWLGPGLSVLRHDPASTTLTVLPPDEARALVITHAFSPTPGWLERAAAAPLGTPIADAIAMVQRAVPGTHIVESVDRQATLLRLPDLLFTIVAGKYFDLEGERRHRGGDAVDLVFSLGACRLPPAPRSVWPSLTATTTVPATMALPPPPPTTTTTTTPTGPAVLIPVAWTGGQRFGRAVALGGAGFLLSPAVAAPLLLAGAVPWLIGMAAVWVALIPGVKAALARWEARAVRPALRLEDGVLHLPAHLALAPIPMSDATLSTSWQADAWARPSHGGTRPAAVRLHVTHGEVKLAFVALGKPPPGRGFPHAPSSFDGIGHTVVELERDAFWRLHRAVWP